jgi:cytochrome b561
MTQFLPHSLSLSLVLHTKKILLIQSAISDTRESSSRELKRAENFSAFCIHISLLALFFVFLIVPFLMCKKKGKERERKI